MEEEKFTLISHITNKEKLQKDLKLRHAFPRERDLPRGQIKDPPTTTLLYLH
jgi:hypothetical protein